MLRVFHNRNQLIFLVNIQTHCPADIVDRRDVETSTNYLIDSS